VSSRNYRLWSGGVPAGIKKTLAVIRPRPSGITKTLNGIAPMRATRDREREDRRIVNTRIGGW
jgi:hypothetical protein